MMARSTGQLSTSHFKQKYTCGERVLCLVGFKFYYKLLEHG